MDPYAIFGAPGQNAPKGKMTKDHASRLAAKAGDYYRAKATPRNFCKPIEEVEEGRQLLQAFDECCGDGMPPEEGTNLILKCAGAMGGPLTGPLAATLATRPVKKLADATGMDSIREVAKAMDDEPVTEEMREQAREILKTHPDQRPDGTRSVHTKAHYRVKNGRVEYIMDYDSQRHGAHPQANLHQRSVRGANVHGANYIRATDSEDRDHIMECARRMGVEVSSHRASGANHHGRQSSYPHVYFHNAQDAARVHAALANHGDHPQEPNPGAAAEAPAMTITPEQVRQHEEPQPEPAPAPAAPAQTNAFTRHQPAGILERRIVMKNTNGTSDKFYAVDVRQVGEGAYVVNVASGRNGARNPRVETKTPTPVSLRVANALADRTRVQKTQGGYETHLDGQSADRGLQYPCLDNFSHPTTAGGATPNRAITESDYTVLRQNAWDAGQAARNLNAYDPRYLPAVQRAITAHEAALEAAQALWILNGDDRGVRWHQGRLTDWRGVIPNPSAQIEQAALTYASANRTAMGGAGFTAALNAGKVVIDRLNSFPEGATLPPAITPAFIKGIRQSMRAFSGGALMENAVQTAQGKTANQIMDKMVELTSEIAAQEMHVQVPDFVHKQATLHHAITAAQEAIAKVGDLLQKAQNDEAQPEEALEAATAAAQKAAAVNTAAVAIAQPWSLPLVKLLGLALEKASEKREAVQRLANRPRVADHRYADKWEPLRQQSDNSHEALRTNPTSHAHHRVAFDHAKQAAVAIYNEALKKQGAERQRLHALANTYAERVQQIAATYATLGRR